MLNADDERLARLPENPRVAKLSRKVSFVALDPDNPVIRRHRAAGGTAFFLRNGWLVEAVGGGEHRLVSEAAVPFTLGGAAKFQTANALAAAAACRAMGLGREQVASGLAGFQSGRDNHGRMNLYRVRRGYVVVDYGHNPGAFAALCELAQSWAGRRVTGVFTALGDRTDEAIDQLGRLAARCFSRLIIREDEDLRGRRPGEVADLLCRAAGDEAPGKECRFVRGETDALRVALEEMEDGEVVVFFYEKYTEPSLDVLRHFDARQASAVGPLAVPQPA